MQDKINKANSKLEKITIFHRGKKLSLRATLPPKPGDGYKNKQYTLSPGFPATDEGLKLTLIEAQRIEADLIYGRFSWDVPKDQLTVEKAIAEFEKDFWNRKEKTINRVETFKNNYLVHFLYLPQDQLLSEELLIKALLTVKPDTYKRKSMASAYSCLLNYFNIEHDLKRYRGNYKPNDKREIPTEEEIDSYWENNCKTPQWKWVYGIIACYGIRPHEIFHLDCSRMREYPPVLKVLEGTKTGYRYVCPIPNEKRVINWNLAEKVLPNINTEGKSNKELGGKISQKFIRLGIPSPYHFRDAYAIRGAILNFNPATVAQWMGHSLDVHDKKYLRHITHKHLTDAWLLHQ